MTFLELKNKIASRAQELQLMSVQSLSVFGSVARDEAQADSDVDLLVEFSGPATFDRFMTLKIFLEDLLSCKVDLVTPTAVRRQLRSRVEQELRRVA